MNSKTKWIIIIAVALAIAGGVVYAQATGLLSVPASTTVVTPANLTINPSTLTFGEIVQGQSVQKTAVITNIGDKPTAPLQVLTDGIAEGLTITHDLPETIAAGQSVSVTFIETADSDATQGVCNYVIIVEEVA